jgi:uncharacterized protein YabE (DUF348 family)
MRHPLPYAFAKAHHVLLQDDGHQRVLWTAPQTSTSALSEVLRLHTVDMLQRESSRDLEWGRSSETWRRWSLRIRARTTERPC